MTVLSLSTKQKYGTLLGPNSAFIPGHYESISTVSVGSGGVSSISFTSIPSTYTHLQIRGIARTARTGQNGDFFKTTFNSDTGTNYSWHLVSGDGASTGVPGGSTVAYMEFDRFSTNTANTNVFGAAIMDIFDYGNTNKYKTIRYIGGYDNNGSGEIQFGSGNWRSTSAITSITLTQSGAYNILQYSRFALYGIKVA